MKIRPQTNWADNKVVELHLKDTPLESFLRKEVQKYTPLQLPFGLSPADKMLEEDYKVNWLVKGLVPEKSLIHIYGPTASFKTFFTVELFYCVATGINFFGLDVTQGPVVYIAGEGHHGLKPRIKAQVVRHGKPAENIFISDLPAKLSDEQNIQDIIDSIKIACPDVKLIVVDTLHRNMGDGDENSASDIAKILSGLDRIKNETGASILLVHHTGHGNNDRARGSSAIRAAMDVEYSIVFKNGLVTMTCTKSKDFEEPSPKKFKPTSVNTGWFDEDGFPITSIVLEEVGSFYEPQVNNLTPLQQQSLADLARLILDEGISPSQEMIDAMTAQHQGVEPPERIIDVVVWRKSFTDNYIEDGKLPNSAGRSFRRIKNDLLDAQVIQNFQDYVWLS